MLQAHAGSSCHCHWLPKKHPSRTSSSTELLSDPTLPYLCSYPGAKCSADALASVLTPTLIKPWLLFSCSWMLRGRGGGGWCYDSFTTQIPRTCCMYSTYLWIQRMWRGSDGKDKDVDCRFKDNHATCGSDSQHNANPALVSQIACIQQLQLVLHAVKDPWPSHAVGWEHEPASQPPPAHTSVIPRVEGIMFSALSTGKIAGRRIFFQ